jgi:HSP20 family protein
MLAIRSPLLTDFALDAPFRALLDTALQGGVPDLRAFSPATDVRETDEAYVLEFDVPGLSEKELDVVIEHNQLTLRGERKPLEGASFTRQERAFGRFERTFHLADDVDATRIGAQAKNGVLTVTLPKAEKAKARTIAVKSE